jgi:Zn-dependent peptidase ImmA (M78 family)
MIQILQMVTQIETAPLSFEYMGKEIVVVDSPGLYDKKKIQGYVEKGKDGAYDVYLDISVINMWIHETDVKRFLIAHEIGHIMLGHVDTKTDIWKAEGEADCFALKLLAENGINGRQIAEGYYDMIVDETVSGRPGRIAHMGFIEKCDN